MDLNPFGVQITIDRQKQQVQAGAWISNPGWLALLLLELEGAAAEIEAGLLDGEAAAEIVGDGVFVDAALDALLQQAGFAQDAQVLGSVVVG